MNLINKILKIMLLKYKEFKVYEDFQSPKQFIDRKHLMKIFILFAFESLSKM